MKNYIVDKFLISQQNKNKVFTFTMNAKDFIQHSRIVRARNSEWTKELDGVQRKLNLKRVVALRKFLLEDISTIPVSFIVNICTQENSDKSFKWNSLIGNNTITIAEDDLVVIDGQHRLAAFDYSNYNESLNDPQKWIRFPILSDKEKKKLDDFELIIVGYKNLSRIEMATIFISINNNQKRISKSVIFDLLQIEKQDVDNLKSPELENILLTWMKFEQIRATGIVEQLSEDPDSCWFNKIKFEWTWNGGQTIELWSFVEHLSLAMGEKRFLGIKNFPYHSDRYEFIKRFYNILVESVFPVRSTNIEWDILYTTSNQQFSEAHIFLSKPSGIGITLNSNFIDYIMKELWIYSSNTKIVDWNNLRLLFTKLGPEDFSSLNIRYKWKLSSKAGYADIAAILKEKLW